MASTEKTPLGLSQWGLDEIPDVDDFNADNRKIDAAIAAIAPPPAPLAAPVIGSYVGNNAEERTFVLAFQPSFGMIFAVEKVIIKTISGTSMTVYSAFLSKQGCSEGAYIEDSGFTVTSSASMIDGRVSQLNVTGITYAYIMFP